MLQWRFNLNTGGNGDLRVGYMYWMTVIIWGGRDTKLAFWIPRRPSNCLTGMVVWLGEMVAISHADGTKEGKVYKKQNILKLRWGQTLHYKCLIPKRLKAFYFLLALTKEQVGKTHVFFSSGPCSYRCTRLNKYCQLLSNTGSSLSIF